MKKAFIKNLVFLISLLISSPFIRGQELTLSEALKLASENNYKIKQFAQKLESASYKDLDAFGNFLPKINFTSSYTHLNDPVVFDLDPVRQVILNLQAKNQTELTNIYGILSGAAPLTDQQKTAVFGQAYSGLSKQVPLFREVLKQQDYKTATLTFVQPLFTGGKILSYKKITSAAEEAASLELKKVRDEVMHDVINTYTGVMLAENAVKTRRDVLEGIKKHHARTRNLFEEGLTTRFNVIRAEVAVSDAERDLTDDVKRLETAYLALYEIIGAPADCGLIIKQQLRLAEDDKSAEFFEEALLAGNPLIKIMELKKYSAEKNFDLERARFLPQLAAFGKYEMYPEYLSTLEPRWAVGINLSINIFNGLQDYAALETASGLEKEVGYLENEVKSKLTLLMQKSYKELEAASERYRSGESGIRLAEENLRLNEKRFETGLGTSLEVIDAQLLYEKFMIEQLVSVREYYRALNELFTLTGKPEEILKFIN